ncbi:hypothetical protein Taro_017151 [Colocasia esculenta]|uniref:Uncharacterized protein n=1 Tax=Colocasia esculenta TaxID=4460 RepID=A0A843UME1_COLES|nr:hypothetical protein [Colocasia esculenta]
MPLQMKKLLHLMLRLLRHPCQFPYLHHNNHYLHNSLHFPRSLLLGLRLPASNRSRKPLGVTTMNLPSLPSVPHVAQLLAVPHVAQLLPMPLMAHLLIVPHVAHLHFAPHAAYPPFWPLAARFFLSLLRPIQILLFHGIAPSFFSKPLRPRRSLQSLSSSPFSSGSFDPSRIVFGDSSYLIWRYIRLLLLYHLYLHLLYVIPLEHTKDLVALRNLGFEFLFIKNSDYPNGSLAARIGRYAWHGVPFRAEKPCRIHVSHSTRGDFHSDPSIPGARNRRPLVIHGGGSSFLAFLHLSRHRLPCLHTVYSGKLIPNPMLCNKRI